MILNDLSFQLFFKEKQVNSREFFHGINGIVTTKDSVNIREGSLKIAILSNEKRLWVIRNLASYVSNKIMSKGVSLFREAFKKIFRKPSPENLVDYFKHQVAFGANDQVENYTTTHFFNATMKVLVDYCHSKGINLKEN
jgi:hypothetical protein